MKKIFLIILFVTLYSNSQETEFKFTHDGFTDYIVTKCPGKTQAELFKKTFYWASTTFKNPKLIKSTLENDYIIIKATSKNLICFNSLTKSCASGKFVVKISFKDEKYKFDVISVEYVYSEEKTELNITNPSVYYNNKGELRSTYKYFPEIADYFNSLNANLKNFDITSKDVAPKKSDW